MDSGLLKFVVYMFCFHAFLALGTESSIVGFSTWKDQQVVEAQNLVVRLSNKILTERKRLGREEPAEIAIKALKLNEDELEIRKDSLQFAQNLTFEDYVANYLSGFEDDDMALSEAIEKWSSIERLSLLKVHLKMRRNKEWRFKPRITGVPAEEKGNSAL